MTPRQFAPVEALTRSQPRPTSDRLRKGSFFREAAIECRAAVGAVPTER